MAGMGTSPTARSLAYCRRMGWPAGTVERYNPHSRTRHDLFGWCDLIVVAKYWLGGYPSPGGKQAPIILGVQACAGPSHAARMAKARPLVGPWLAAGGAAEVWSWSKTGPRGKRKVWTLRREAIAQTVIVAAGTAWTDEDLYAKWAAEAALGVKP